MNEIITFRLNIHAYVMPYVRMTRKGKFVDPRAQEYIANQEELKFLLRQRMAFSGYEIMPKSTPLIARLSFYRLRSDMHTSDLDNLVKAMFDAMNKIVYPDDRWIDEFTAARRISDFNAAVIDISTL